MAFKTRDAAMASLKALTFIDPYGDYERDEAGEMKTVDDEAVWIATKTPLTQVYADPRNDNVIILGNDDGVDWFDHSGECKGGYPWINEVLLEWAKTHGYDVQWRDPGSLWLAPF
jgi:hypothetical protein